MRRLRWRIGRPIQWLVLAGPVAVCWRNAGGHAFEVLDPADRGGDDDSRPEQPSCRNLMKVTYTSFRGPPVLDRRGSFFLFWSTRTPSDNASGSSTISGHDKRPNGSRRPTSSTGSPTARSSPTCIGHYNNTANDPRSWLTDSRRRNDRSRNSSTPARSSTSTG